MKLNIYKHLRTTFALMLLSGALVSCEDLLDQEPPSYIVPEDYYKTEQQVQACANKFYTDLLPSHGYDLGLYGGDNNTDNQAGTGADGKYADGQWLVGTDNGNWSWGTVREINYQLNTILGYYNQGQITGTDKNIRHYIGELYFFRAYKYFSLLKLWGDLPIVTEVLPDDAAVLTEADKRKPRNEVARFIIAQLDTAITYMSEDFEARHTRLSPDVARLVRANVALFEGSWLTYFKGTPFVPNGEGWPGKTKDYNADYEYPTGNIDNEIAYFLGEAVKSSEEVAEKYKGRLVKNTGVIPQSTSDPENPYFSMFGTLDMSAYPEVLLWREYSQGLGVCNDVESRIQRGNGGIGLTRSLVESFLMEDGKPIYVQHDGYTYDDNSLNKVVQHRDPRLVIFLKVPGQINCFKNMDDTKGDRQIVVEPEYPDITNGSNDWLYSTGYALRKGGTFDRSQCIVNGAANAACSFRATEALLIYMEAEYMLTKNLNAGHTLEYWRIVREAAGFTGEAADPQTTIAATDMQQEKLDWGAYSAGQLLDDPILYNIRRERRCELMGEAKRWDDLIRWRALDQLMTEPYHIEGFHLWNSDMTHYYGFQPESYDGSGNAVVSSPDLSEYLRPYEKNMTANNLYRNGYTWHLAHYLQPLPTEEMRLTSPDQLSVDQSTLYQNPYWPTEPGLAAER